MSGAVNPAPIPSRSSLQRERINTSMRTPTLATTLAALVAASIVTSAPTAIASATPAPASIHRAIVNRAAATSTRVPPDSTSFPANIEFDPGSYGTYNQAALSNPSIGAVDINLNWYDVEPQPGVFNFAPADQEVAAWVNQGKKVTLELRFQHEAADVPGASCSSDGWLPTWVVTSVSVLCEQVGAIGLVVPDYFDPAFQADWHQYVAAVATHFANGPYRDDVTYARVALGLGAESFPLLPCYSPYVQHCSASAYRTALHVLQSWGFTASAWLKWQESQLSYYKNELSFTTVIYPVSQMLYPLRARLNIDPKTGNPIQMDVAYWAAAHGIGIGQEGLDGRYTSDYAKFNEIAAYVHRRFPKAYIQFQTVAAIGAGTSTCSATCLVEKDVRAAELYHAHSIEWYTTDDSNPSLQPAFTQWEAFVDG